MNLIPHLRALLGRRGIALAAVLAALGLSSGCLEQVNAEVETKAEVAKEAQQWRLAGEFGGEAKLSVDDPDPYKQRFEAGGFIEPHGVCATGGEVWVTDLGISRLQVFDPEGNFLRSYGQGQPLASTLPSLERLYEDRTKRLKDGTSWDATMSAFWRGTQGRFFQFSDVLPQGDKLWVLDQAKTGVTEQAARSAGMRAFTLPDPELGSLEDLGTTLQSEGGSYAYPESLATDGETLITGEPWGNMLRLYNVLPGQDMRSTLIGQNPSLQDILRLQVGLVTNPQYEDFLRRDTHSNGAPGKFAHLGGAAVAFRKIIACDGGAKRIQVFDGNSEDPFYWGKLLKVVNSRGPDGFLRFETPFDLDVAKDGTVYVIDGKRLEVAVLNSRFERIGSFGAGSLIEPQCIDVSDDGLHVYVTDTRYDKVLHFIREK